MAYITADMPPSRRAFDLGRLFLMACPWLRWHEEWPFGPLRCAHVVTRATLTR
jgi:hypothetical protein